MDKIQYCKFDPTGNITALVETKVDIADQPAVAARIMEEEPDVEQVGFITYVKDAAPADGSALISLRMAGGEFCGNATMCAAAHFASHGGLQSGAVPVQVSGASAPLIVRLEQLAPFSYSAAVSMPPALRIGKVSLTAADAAGGPEEVGAAGVSAMMSLPVVEMEGISHIIIEHDSDFFGIKDDKPLAESMLKHWCGVLGADCLGMLFLGEGDAGMYLAAKSGSAVDVTFEEPAGRLRVESDPATGLTILHGSAILIEHRIH